MGVGPIGPFELLLILILAAIVLGPWLWPAWVLCGKVAWSGWLVLLLVVPIAGLIFSLMLVWEALPRAGYHRSLVLLLFVPVVNVVMLFWLAFGRWPQEVPPVAQRLT